jgi:S1-C subfamily serine protease
MKKFLTIFTLVFIFNTYAQNTSTINFVAFKDYGWVFSIYLNEQLVGTIGKNENLEYKLTSEGRISVIIIAQSQRYTGFLDVKKGGTYYYVVSAYPNKQGVTDSKRGQEIFASNANTLKAEEDKKRPLVQVKNDEDIEGPKQGTCFLISNKGYLLTNYHVISGSKNVQIKGVGGDFSTLYGADVIAFDIDLDLALIKLKNKNVTFDSIPYSFCTDLNQQGAKTFVLGYPLTTSMGDEIKITEGIISSNSGFKGTISQYQFSAPVQPGNSGSPLFNEKGDVLGIINAKLSGAEGAGYAVKSQYIPIFLKLIDNIQMESCRSDLGNMTLSQKIMKLKNYIFIVKSE